MSMFYENVKKLLSFATMLLSIYAEELTPQLGSVHGQLIRPGSKLEIQKEERSDSEMFSTISQYDEMTKNFATQAITYGCLVTPWAGSQQNESTKNPFLRCAWQLGLYRSATPVRTFSSDRGKKADWSCALNNRKSHCL